MIEGKKVKLPSVMLMKRSLLQIALNKDILNGIKIII